MKTYRLLSTPMIHTPSVFQWIIETVRPFDKPKARKLLAALGLPETIASRFSKSDPLITWKVGPETESVLVTA